MNVIQIERGSPEVTYAVEFCGVTKSFGTVIANDDVNFGVRKGTIHGIIGENGAGKSTLMSILFGLYHPDRGEIFLNGARSDIKNPSTAIHAGIGMVHQHFMLVERMTALQNVVLGKEDGFWLKGGTGNVTSKVQALQAQYGLHFPLDAVTRDLPVGVQQRIEILKALYRGAEVLILDEPTGVLTPGEVQELFKVFKDLKAQGKTVILITHKLQEILSVTDSVTVLRQGKSVGTYATAETDRMMLATLMVGRRPNAPPQAREPRRPDIRVEVDQLSVRDNLSIQRVFDLSFQIHAGEVLGIAGVAGNGQSELIAALAGLASPMAGRIRLGSLEMSADRPAHPEAIRENGVGHVPEDRHRLGMMKRWTAAENSILGLHRSGKIDGVGKRIQPTKVSRWCQDLMKKHDVRPADSELRFGLFSGGNQQKLVIGRELALSPDILLIGQPTRGVDIGAIENIHAALLSERDKGKSVLLISVELEEVLALSDRILVMFEGRSMGIVGRADADEKLLGLMMAGLPPG
ncbi:ABC transporter ATP-binding protein [Ensifer canadensis]